jgi:hypothetical protein
MAGYLEEIPNLSSTILVLEITGSTACVKLISLSVASVPLQQYNYILAYRIHRMLAHQCLHLFLFCRRGFLRTTNPQLLRPLNVTCVQSAANWGLT